jgi:hypothetical protein
MAGAQIPTSVTILNSLHGYMALSLKNYATSAAGSIAAGSIVEIAGAFFTFAGDEAIEASTWTSIVTGQTAYINLAASGTAGSQIVSATYTNVAPTWRDDLQGWYASAASSVRVIGSVYKAEATNYSKKYLYSSMQEGKQNNISVLTASVNGININPYKVTTESWIKAGIGQYVFSALTTISTVYTICGGYCIFSSTNLTFIATLHLSNGSIYAAQQQFASGSNATFYVTYQY